MFRSFNQIIQWYILWLIVGLLLWKAKKFPSGCELKLHQHGAQSCAQLPEPRGKGSAWTAQTSPSPVTLNSRGLENEQNLLLSSLPFIFALASRYKYHSLSWTSCLGKQNEKYTWNSVTRSYPLIPNTPPCPRRLASVRPLPPPPRPRYLIRASFAIFFLVLVQYSFHEQKVLQLFWAEFHLQPIKLQILISLLSFWN